MLFMACSKAPSNSSKEEEKRPFTFKAKGEAGVDCLATAIQGSQSIITDKDCGMGLEYLHYELNGPEGPAECQKHSYKITTFTQNQVVIDWSKPWNSGDPSCPGFTTFSTSQDWNIVTADWKLESGKQPYKTGVIKFNLTPFPPAEK